MESPRLFCWPDSVQELLLRATIEECDAARRSWELWTPQIDIDILEEGSVRLLPETYTHLKSCGVEHALFRLIKGVKRKTWLQNQLLFHQAGAAIRILQGLGLETMVTKGPALVLRHYLDYGRRPMADFDIVIKKEGVEEAVKALHENGFRLKDQDHDASDRSLTHALSYVNETGRQFDLHWQVIPGCTDEQLFWDDATPVAVAETMTLAPSATDLLFHVCVHGLRLNRVHPFRWVVDAAVILKDSQVDWDRFRHLSSRLWMGHHTSEALKFLTRFDVDIPDHVLSALSRNNLASLQRLEFELNTGLRRKSIGTQIAIMWLGFSRFADSKAGGFRIAQLPDYLKRIWGVDSVWRLPIMAVQKGIRRIFLNPAG
ncbi:MAG TPA: nucleotidyltransferase family protein [Rhodothermales bacterium]|nr:nucleotidyltransferase family protein [Rhodothermales bacterium]